MGFCHHRLPKPFCKICSPKIKKEKEMSTNKTGKMGKPAATAEMTEFVMPGDTNHMGTCFGGKIMQWIDVCAAIAAQRFISSEMKCQVVTASVDSIQFHAPAKLGNVITLKAMVNRAWKTSMEIGVKVLTEDPITGVEIQACRAYLTFVAVNSDGKPQDIPFFISVSSEETIRRSQEAENRRTMRLELRNKR